MVNLRDQQTVRSVHSPMALEVPHIELELLKWLRLRFQVKVGSDKTLREYDRQAGHQELIEHLQSLYDRQQEEQ